MVKEVYLEGYKKYILENKYLSVSILELGAICTSIKYLGSEMTLWNESPSKYLSSDAYMGAIIGRCANKICNGKFKLNGITYNVDINDGSDQLHGGNNAFDKRIYELDRITENSITLKLFSKDGDNGFPGNLLFKVTYELIENSLVIRFNGVCDQDSILAPTSHIYFRFNNENMKYSRLKIDADKYVKNVGKIDASISEVNGKYDLRTRKEVNFLLDDCYLLNKGGCILIKNGIKLTVDTDFEALQIYTGGELNGDYKPFDGIAIEAEFIPDSINHDDWNKPIIKKDEEFNKYVKYTFDRKM